MPSATLALVRGLVKRCPRCGQGRLFTRWFTLTRRCPRCDLALERSDGFWLGAMAINLGATEAVFGALGIAWAVLAWPDVPWTLVTVVGIALNAVFPFVFYPFSKTIFLAIDLVLHRADNASAAELEVLEREGSMRAWRPSRR